MSMSKTKDRTLPAFSLVALLVTAGLAGCTSALTDPDPESPPLFAQAWGTYGGQDGQFNVLTGVAVDAAGHVYATDSANNRVQKFSNVGVHLASWGSLGSANGQMKSPSGIAVDAAGDVYVIDSLNYRVQKFSNSGVFLAKWGSYGSADGQFKMPRGIAVDAQGNVFVSDASTHRVQKFDASGAFVAKWGGYGSGDGQMKFPRGLAVDAGGFVYLADYSNDRIQMFTNAGGFVAKWGATGAGDGQFSRPYGVAVDHAGAVYVTDVLNHRVQKLTALGGFLAAWGGHGHNPGEFVEPYGIAVDASKNVFVVDGGHHRLQKFRYVPDAIAVDVLLDGLPWAGPVAYSITGPQTVAGSTAPHVATPAAAGAYTLAYLSGGPPGAHLLNSTSFGPKTLSPGGAVTFTLNFTAPTAVKVLATLNGSPWSGSLNHTIQRIDISAFNGFYGSWSTTYPGVSVPSMQNITPGTGVLTVPGLGTGLAVLAYVNYVSGGPAGASYTGATTSFGSPVLMEHHTRTTTFHFRSDGLTPNSIVVNATLDGAPWSGPVGWQVDQFTIPQPPGSTFVGGSVPHALLNVPQANTILTDPTTNATGPGAIYLLQHTGGGPPGASLAGITPAFYAVLHHNGTKTFTLDFVSPPGTVGAATVGAMLDGAPWTGALSYTLAGPQTVSGASAASSHASLPVGAYTLAYVSGGPANASFTSVGPSATQTVTAGNATSYVLHFRSHPTTGAIKVNATLDGAPWTGAVNYTLTGGQAITGTAAPQTFMGAAGTYTLAFVSGGPAGANLVSILPSATQTLAGGGGAAFTLVFESKEQRPEPGTIVVEATLAGAGGAVVWTGPLNFTLSGPQTLLGSSVGQNFAMAPAGTYTLAYGSGGPPGATLHSITSAPTQTLSPGGTVTFRLNFR